MKNINKLPIAVLSLLILGACSRGSSGGDQAAASPGQPSTPATVSKAADLDVNVANLNNACANQGLKEFAAPQNAKEVDIGQTGAPGTYEYAGSKLMNVSFTKNGSHAVILVSDQLSDGQFAPIANCEDVVAKPDITSTAADGTQTTHSYDFSANGNLSAPLKTVFSDDGSATSYGTRKISVEKSNGSDKFEISVSEDSESTQTVTKEENAKAATQMASNDKLQAKAYLSDDGLTIIMRIAPGGEALDGEYIKIFMKKIK